MESVEALDTEAASPKYRKMTKGLIAELEKGKTLSSFLEKEKRIFNVF